MADEGAKLAKYKTYVPVIFLYIKYYSKINLIIIVKGLYYFEYKPTSV